MTDELMAMIRECDGKYLAMDAAYRAFVAAYTDYQTARAALDEAMAALGSTGTPRLALVDDRRRA